MKNMKHYLQEELDHDAILGPFKNKPINLHISPFMTRDKPDSTYTIQSCHEWHIKRFCSKRQLQSLLGSLLYICKCVKPARVFLNCMLTRLGDNANNDTIFLSKEFSIGFLYS